MSFTLYLAAYVVLLVAGIYGVVTKDWRGALATLAIALVLLILLVVEHR